MPEPVRPTIATVLSARDAERHVLEDGPLGVAPREVPELDVARERRAGVGFLGKGRRLPDVHHPVPRRGAALPEVHDPAERDRRPDELHHVEVELDVARDRQLAREDEAPARPEREREAEADEELQEREEQRVEPREAEVAAPELAVVRVEARLLARLARERADEALAREVLLRLGRDLAEELLDLREALVRRLAHRPSSRSR